MVLYKGLRDRSGYSQSHHQPTMIKISVILCCILPLIRGTPLTDHRNELDNSLDGFVHDELAYSNNDVPNPEKLAEQAGYAAETYEIVTEDRYVLSMCRIIGRNGSSASPNKPAVLLLHGLLDSGASWIFPGPGKGLALILSDWGYDVWVGNARGNRYSRRHLDWTVRDPEFWEFSWHEIGFYDIPAMIDHIVDKTWQEKILYIGHSQGGTSFFVMASERPEYQKKITAAFTLAPAVFMSRTRHLLIRMLAPLVNNIKGLADLIGMHEFKPSGKLIQTLAKTVCDEDSLLEPVCQNIMFLIAGVGEKDLNTTLIPVIGQYDPAGSSTKQFVHYAQLVNSGRFQQYDHGCIRNLKKYGTLRPPSYKLANIKIPVYLHYSNNDAMVNAKNLQQLYSTLPNAQKLLVPFKCFTHLDFLWGKHADVWLYNKILGLMERHRK